MLYNKTLLFLHIKIHQKSFYLFNMISLLHYVLETKANTDKQITFFNKSIKSGLRFYK